MSPPACAKCGKVLILKGIHASEYPYIHSDLRAECPQCGEIYLFGIPQRKDVGLALHVMDSNPKDAVVYQVDLGPRVCPYRGHGEMMPTKVFGDFVYDTSKIEYQWKCAKCFLTRHELHDRKFSHGGGYDPTPEEMADTVARLKRLGYIE
jgi:DNA-directed RNA polymerase subunit RPC12/RpoP